ncbi:MAG: hypothetical protein COT85_02575 [Chlamydiae bacterium CG10_big_fil_rev_8_21_14_0_10_42_34]|nr:MAG: hypothetical protein COT85_02575 [Chlamydiae bacterium CG10_big_fil_rev_8_21_14_0_10_42_34]
MATLVGGMLVCGGTWSALDAVVQAPKHLSTLRLEGVSSGQKTLKIAGTMFFQLGVLFMSVGAIAAGATLWKAEPATPPLTVFHETISQSLGWVAGGFASIMSGVTLYNSGGPLAANANDIQRIVDDIC